MVKSTDPRMGKIPGAGGHEWVLWLLPAGLARHKCRGPPKWLGGLPSAGPEGWRQGHRTDIEWWDPTVPGGCHPSASPTRSSPSSAEGTPGDLADAENAHSHLTGRGAGARRGAAGLSGLRWRRRAGCQGVPPAAGRARKGPGSLQRAAAAHCSRRQSSRGRLLPGSCGILRDTVPRGQWGQPGVGPLRPRCWQRQGLCPPGVPHASRVPVLPCGQAPIVPRTACVSLGRACRSFHM